MLARPAGGVVELWLILCRKMEPGSGHAIFICFIQPVASNILTSISQIETLLSSVVFIENYNFYHVFLLLFFENKQSCGEFSKHFIHQEHVLMFIGCYDLVIYFVNHIQ